MMPSRVVRRLIWKSARQAVPLVVLLVVLISLLVVVIAKLSVQSDWRAWNILLSLIPILFSVGAGSTLISIDRDSKAIDWLKSLPLRWQSIAFTPVAVSAVILVLLWGVVLSYISFVSVPLSDQVMELLRTNPTYYVAHSFYLLLCGFAAAWMLRAPLPALLTIMPLAAIPAMIEYSWQAYKRWSTGGPKIRYLPDLDMTQALGVLGICGLVMLGLMSLCARRVLSPAIHRSATSGTGWHIVTHQLARIVESFQSNTRQETQPMFRMSTLLWGFYRENRGTFRAAQVSAVLFVCLFYIVQNDLVSGFLNALSIGVLVPTGLLLAVVPTLTFQADSVGARIRFLTDRGVGPRELWWSRQLVILGIVSLFGCMIWLTGHTQWRSPPTSSWAMLFALLFNAYAISQWIGQIISRVTIAIFTSLVAVAFSSSFISTLGNELWIAAVGDIALFFATYWMTLPWMERRTDWRYGLRHATFLLPLLILFFSIFIGQLVALDISEALTSMGHLDGYGFAIHRGMIVIFSAYAISQWIDQRVERVVFSTAASMLAVILGANLILALGTYFWVALVVDLALLFDTYRLMQQPTIRKSQCRSVFEHAAFVLPITFLLSASAVAPWAFPASDLKNWAIAITGRNDITAWLSEAAKLQQTHEPEISLQIDWPVETVIEPANLQAQTPEDRKRIVIDSLEILNQRYEFDRHRLFEEVSSQIKPGAPIQNSFVPSSLIGHADRMGLEAIQNKDGQSAEAYLQLVNLTTRLTAGLRLSRELWSQESADRTEIWLIKQCLTENTRGMIDTETFDAICSLVGNKQRRWTSRRNAVLVALWQSHHMDSSKWRDLPALCYEVPHGVSPERFFQILLRDIDATRSHMNEVPMKQLRELRGLSPTDSNPSEYLNWVMPNDARKYALAYNASWQIAMLWGAGWETQGENLLELASEKVTKMEETEK